MSVTALYFASLRERTGVERERVEATGSVAQLYETLRARHGFAFARDALRVAVNGVFVPWDCPLEPGDEVAFIPPVSGG